MVNKEKFIHVYHLDLDNLISDNAFARDRLVGKLLFYNSLVQSPSWVLPVKDTNVMDMPVLGREHVNEYTPTRRLDKDWVYMSDCEWEDIERYGDELDALHEFIDYQFARAKRELISYHDTPPLLHQDTPCIVDSHTEVSADEKPIGPVCEQADEDMRSVEHETGRLYTATELVEPTSLSEPVDVNHTTVAQYLLKPTMTDIVSKVREIHRVTPTVKMKEKKETYFTVHTTSQVQQPAERLAQGIANLASSEYDMGGRPGEAALSAQRDDRLRNIINVVGTIVRAVEVQRTERRSTYTVNSFRTQRGWGGPAVVEVY